jgi:hypothetical protein
LSNGLLLANAEDFRAADSFGDSMNRAPAIDYNLIFNLGAESFL